MQLLGGLSITLDGTPVRGFLSSKVQALLCYLAATGRAHSREALMGLLWGDMPEERDIPLEMRGTYAGLSHPAMIAHLQKLVGAHLLVTRQTVALNRQGPPLHVDAEQMRALLGKAEQAPFGAHRRLRQAVELYAGDFLSDFYVRDAPGFEEWAVTQREQLRIAVLDALQKLAAHSTERGQYAAAAGFLRRILVMDPWREDAHRRLMLLLCYMGQPDAAAAQYHSCRQTLLRELGEEPASETTNLYWRVREGKIDPPHAYTPPGNLPLRRTALIGRQGEIAQVYTLLEDDGCRLLTLTGPGGIGKTSLALHVASELADDFEHGAFFVPLADTGDPANVPGEIARALGVEESESRTVQSSLSAALRGRQVLLVIDNFEHLMSAAPLVADIMAMAPRIRIMVTSRAPLRLREEMVYAVPALALPSVQDPALPEAVLRSPAVAMFLERARSARPGFQLTDANAGALAEICRRLDGLPLAIELAAVRLQIMPVQALLSRLENQLGVLTGGVRDLPERQRTLRATIEWSYSLLSEEERAFLRDLSVFAGGCTLEAAEAVCGGLAEPYSDPIAGPVEWISALVDNHLIQQQDEQGDSEIRFRMLETIRQYALEKLAESGFEPQARRKHAEYYLTMAQGIEDKITGPEQVLWLERLEAEHENMRAALRWARESNAEGAAELGLRACGTLWRFWERRGYLTEGREWLESLLRLSGEVAPEVRAKALRVVGILAFKQGNLQRAAELCGSSIELYDTLDNEFELAGALNSMGNIRREQGHHHEAEALLTRALSIYRKLGDALGVPIVLNNLGSVAQREGDLERAAELYEESLVLRQAVGDAGGVAYTLDKLGEVAREKGDLDRAVTLCEQSLQMRREVGDKYGMALALTNLGTIEGERHNYASSVKLLEDALELYGEIGEIWGVATALRGLAFAAREQGEHKEAERLYRESLSLYLENGDSKAVALVRADLEQIGASSN